MRRILVTGGDGVLGKSLVQRLAKQGQMVRIMSRKPQPAELPGTLEWAQADVITGAGIREALEGVHTIVNCMSNPQANTYETDVEGLQNFLAQAKQIGVQYVVHISIVGIDRIISPYYQYKLGSELAIIESGIPYLISRIAQFHSFIDYLLSPLRTVEKAEVSIPVDLQIQPISIDDVSAHLAPYIIDGTEVGRLVDFGGPEILTLRELATSWLEAQGMQKAIKPVDATGDLPFFESVAAGFVKGYGVNPDGRVGGITWRDYLKQAYAEAVK